jgi:outer membrane protein
MKKRKLLKSICTLRTLCDLLIAITLIVLSDLVYAQAPLTLDEAISIGLEKNHSLKISMLKAKSVGEVRIEEMQANRLPSLKLYGTYTRLSDITQSAIAIPIPGVPPFSFQTYLPNNYAFRLSVQEPIFTGFRLQNLQLAAEHTSNAAQADVRTDQRSLVFQIRLQYWTLYKLQKTLEAVNKNLEEANAHLIDIRSKLVNGTVLPNDTLKMQVQVSNNELRKIQTEKDIRIAMASLMNTLGLPLDNSITLATEPDAAAPPQQSFSGLIKQAKFNRSELTALDERIEAGKANVIAARSMLYPQVSVGGNLYYSNPNQRYFPVQDAFKATWDASINLSWDLWTWNIAGLQAEQARYNMEQIQESRKQVEDAIELEVTQSYLNMLTSESQIRVAKISVAQAVENLRVVNMQYSKGVANTTDVIDAETAELQAEINLATTIADLNISKAQLAKSIGE